jgi:hypothetical protein
VGTAAPVLARPGCDKNPQTKPGRRAGFDVAHLVAHDRAPSGIKLEVEYGLQDHSRIGLASRMLAPVLADAVQRVVGAVIDAGDRRALRFKAIAHPSCQIGVGAFIEIASANAGQVGDDDDWMLIWPHRLWNTGLRYAPQTVIVTRLVLGLILLRNLASFCQNHQSASN